MAVMAQPWKRPQNGIYYFRREVPAGIRQVIGKRFIQLFGDMLVDQIKRRHIQDFISALLRVT